MTAHNLVITDFIKVLKELKAKGHTLVDLEIKDDLTISLKGVESVKEDLKNRKIGDTDWEQTI